MNISTLRITNNLGEDGGQWICDPADKAKIAYVKKILFQMQQQEPSNEWKLETRGSETFWHTYETTGV